jgi:hypothetical protein
MINAPTNRTRTPMLRRRKEVTKCPPNVRIRSGVLQPLQCSLAVVSGTRNARASLTTSLRSCGTRPQRKSWEGTPETPFSLRDRCQKNAGVPSPSGSCICHALAQREFFVRCDEIDNRCGTSVEIRGTQRFAFVSGGSFEGTRRSSRLLIRWTEALIVSGPTTR